MADNKTAFQWDDPFRLADQLSEEETLVMATARDYAEDKLLPRAIEAYATEKSDPAIFAEMGALGLLGVTTPEAYGGGPLALVKNGDRIVIDAERRQINLAIPAREMAARRRAWRPVKPRYTRGVLAKYASAVTSASLGAVTDQNLKL